MSAPPADALAATAYNDPAGALTAPQQRLAARVQWLAAGTLVAFLIGWCAEYYPFDDLLTRRGTPLGADYPMFYVAGRMFLEGDVGRLYDQAEHQRRLIELFPGLDPQFCLPYRYPPVVAAAMAPLAALPYAVSYGAFLLLSCASLYTAIRLLGDQLSILHGPWRRSILWAVAGWPVTLETFIGGQAAMFALLIVVATIVALWRKQVLLAGCILGLAAYKPNVLLVLAVGLVAWEPRLLRGAAITALAMGLASLAGAGGSVCQQYVELSVNLAANPWDVETPFWKVHSLASWFGLLGLGYHRIVSLGLGLMAAAAVGLICRRRARSDSARWAAFALLISVNGLCNPYTPIYDLSLLIAAALCTAEYLARRPPAVDQPSSKAIQLALAAFFFGPHFSQALCSACGVQVFPLVLTAAALWQTMILRHALSGTFCREGSIRPWLEPQTKL